MLLTAFGGAIGGGGKNRWADGHTLVGMAIYGPAHAAQHNFRTMEALTRAFNVDVIIRFPEPNREGDVTTKLFFASSVPSIETTCPDPCGP